MILGDLALPEIRRLSPRRVALLPLASIEQHGAHLPVITDTALVTEIAKRTEAALPKKVALLPTLWAGCSGHHVSLGGTLSVGSDTYIRVLEDLAECLLSSGFKRIVLLNGHGGNITPATEAIYRLALRHERDATPPWIALASYWHVAAREIAAQTFMEAPRLTHACEYETSMMQALRLDWVNISRANGHRVERHSEFYDPLGYVPSRVSVSETFAQMTPGGAMGNPEKATPEKGRRLFDIIVPPVIEFVEEFSTWSFQRTPNRAARARRQIAAAD